jgi:TRAP transporter TAXI family solute receptor
MLQVLPHIGRRRAVQGSAAALVVLGLLLWWLGPWGEKSPHGTVTISTGARDGVYERYGELLRGELDHDMPDLNVRLQSSEGSQENVERVATGRADFTIAAADAVEQYRLEHRPGWQHLRGCARLYDDYVQLVVPRLSPVRSIKDLLHKRVAIGESGSGVRLIAERVLKAAGLDPQKDIDAKSTGIDSMPKALQDGDIDAFFWSGGLPTRSVSELSEKYNIRFVPLESVVDALHRQGGASAYYRASDMPADAYPAAQYGVPVPTLAVANLLVTTDRVSADLTEQVTRTVIDSRDRIGAKVHAAQHVDLRTALYTDPLKLHQGAARYYRSVKP